MHFAIEVGPFGDYANPRNVVPLAQAAEAAGVTLDSTRGAAR